MLLALILIILVVVLYYKWAFRFWRVRNVPTMEPRFILGNISPNLEPNITTFTRFYNDMKALGNKHGGFYVFFKPTYIVVDLEYVKNIMLTDFQYFPNRGLNFSQKLEPLAINLFSMKGNQWKELRNQMTPLFSSVKLKQLTELMVNCAVPLKETFGGSGPIDVYDTSISFSIDVIGSCAFGIECNSFKYPNAEFKTNALNFFDSDILNLLRLSFIYCWPEIAAFFRLRMIRKKASDFYMNAVRSMVKDREERNYRRNDVLQTLIDLKNGDKLDLSVDGIAAQAFMFFVAGHETTSTTMSFVLFEIAKNEEVQRKLREEIVAVLKKHDGKINYDSLLEMKYAEQVIDETLRMYPPSPIIVRKPVRDYTVPGTNCTIDKDTQVMIPTVAIHYDPEYYPDPNTFDPERFSDANKSKIPTYAYLPFGNGPRMCIAIRFSYIEIKVTLITALVDFELSLNASTPRQVEWDSNSLILKNKYKMLVDFKKIESL